MKSLTLFFLFAVFAQAAPRIDDLIGQPASTMARFGKADGISKSKTYGWWQLKEFHLNVRLDDGKIAQLTINDFLKKKKISTASQAANFLGFTKENGWTHGQEFKMGILDAIFLTHNKHGILKLFATPGDGANYSLINVKRP